MAQPREIRVPEDVMQVPEGWEIDGDAISIPLEDVDSLEEAIRAAATCVRFIGGVIQIASVREELAPRIFIPREYVWRWVSYFPPARSNGAQEEVSPEAEAAEQAA